MNYLKIHNNIVENARIREFSGYGEVHHVIPRCLGGTDEETNLVRLTAKEHYLIHRLLIKIYPSEHKLKFALNMMLKKAAGQGRHTPRSYDAVKKANSEALSVLHKGKPKSEAHKKKIAEGNKGKTFSEESKQKMSDWQKGKPKPWQSGKKRPVGPKYGRKPGTPGKYTGTLTSHKKQAETLKSTNKPSFNKKGYEILTPSGFQPFHGIGYSGLVPCLTLTLESGKSITVSKRHRFNDSKIATEYTIGDYLYTIDGASKISKIEEAGKKQVYDVLEADGGHLFYANGIINHNCEIKTDSDHSVIPEFTSQLKAETVKEWQRPGRYDAYVSMDLGTKDLTAIIWAYFDFMNNKLVIEDEYSVTGSKVTVSHLADKIREVERRLYTDPQTHVQKEPYRRISDNNEAIARQGLATDHDILFIPTRKDDKDAALHVLRDKIEKGQIIINPRCKQVIFHLENATWNKNKSSFDRSPEGGHYDFIDALIYLVRNVDFHKNPYPREFREGPGGYYKDPNSELSGSAQVFKNLFKKK